MSLSKILLIIELLALLTFPFINLSSIFGLILLSALILLEVIYCYQEKINSKVIGTSIFLPLLAFFLIRDEMKIYDFLAKSVVFIYFGFVLSRLTIFYLLDNKK